MTTLTKGADVLTLSDHLLWTDEFAFNKVAAGTSYGIDGALFVDEGVRLAGQPMTLEAGANWGWMTRAVVDTLEAWKALPGQLFTLNYRGVDHSVLMDHARGALSAVPRRSYAVPEAGDFYIVTLRFLKV